MSSQAELTFFWKDNREMGPESDHVVLCYGVVIALRCFYHSGRCRKEHRGAVGFSRASLPHCTGPNLWLASKQVSLL